MKPKPSTKTLPLRNPSRHLGFTLVEVMVVISIIAVLALVVVAMTRKIKQKALQTNALSSLRQVAVFSVAYSTEENGNINTYRWPTDKFEGTPSWIKNTFWGRLQPYIFTNLSSSDSNFGKNMTKSVESLFQADTSNKTYKGTAFAGPRTFADTSGVPMPFSFNQELYPFNEWKKTSSVRDPSQILYAVIGYGHFKLTHAEKYEPMVTNGTKNPNPIYYMPDRKVLASFVDGHVETLTVPISERNLK